MQETERSAKTEATREVRMRIMGIESEGIRKKEGVSSNDGCWSGILLGWSHVSRLAGSWGAWAAGGGDEGGGGGNEGKFHDFNELVFWWAMA